MKTKIAEMGIVELGNYVMSDFAHEHDGHEDVIMRCAKLATAANAHTLAVLMSVLADEPAEIAADHVDLLRDLATKGHPDTDERRICLIAADALEHFTEE
jgi:isochorismate hydrolase